MSASERAYAAADSWRALAQAAQDASARAGAAAEALWSNNSGDAVDGLVERWRALADPAGGALPQLIELCRGLADQCEGLADRG